MGHYQFAIHTERNRALQISNKQRYNNHMADARHDMSLKAERNIERGDDEFYYSKVVTILGDKVQVFPHTKRVSRYSAYKRRRIIKFICTFDTKLVSVKCGC